MIRKFKDTIYRIIKKYMLRAFPALQGVDTPGTELLAYYYTKKNIGKHVMIKPPAHIGPTTTIGDYTIIARNAIISRTSIGKCCSLGPNLFCGWGIHPSNGISSHTMFYSTKKQSGITLSKEDKIVEQKPIQIGNDVFVGANVTILDGVTIGDGAMIGAGAVVSKDIPPYAIAVGNPIKIVKYRFDEDIIKKLQKIQWWNFPEEQLQDVERMFFDIEGFVEKYYKE